uniref:Uncharacterized protein n=1 Tax=Arundo donax TaxID=35708 RepID=A0A0A9HM23_ARUDO
MRSLASSFGFIKTKCMLSIGSYLWILMNDKLSPTFMIKRKQLFRNWILSACSPEVKMMNSICIFYTHSVRILKSRWDY